MSDMESPAGRSWDTGRGLLLLPLHCGLGYQDWQV